MIKNKFKIICMLCVVCIIVVIGLLYAKKDFNEETKEDNVYEKESTKISYVISNDLVNSIDIIGDFESKIVSKEIEIYKYENILNYINKIPSVVENWIKLSNYADLITDKELEYKAIAFSYDNKYEDERFYIKIRGESGKDYYLMINTANIDSRNYKFPSNIYILSIIKDNKVEYGSIDKQTIGLGAVYYGFDRTIIRSTDNPDLFKNIIKNNDDLLYSVKDTKKGILSEIISPTDYGKKINYAANNITNWRVFYNDSKNVYLISGECVPSSCVDNSKMKLKSSDYNIYYMSSDSRYNYSSSNNLISQIAEQYLLNWYKFSADNSNENVDKTMAMIDTNNWSNFVDLKYAHNAIGGPTLEMFVKSWNAKGYKELYTAYDSMGYYIGKTENPNEYTTPEDVNKGVSVSDDVFGYSDTLYFPTNKNIDGYCTEYWIASPSAYYNRGKYGDGITDIANNLIYEVRNTGNICSGGYKTCGFRPVICLKSDVTGTVGDTVVLDE